MNDKVVTAKAKVFGKVQTAKFMVEADGNVRAYDSVAGYYTNCHSMSKAAVARIRKLAK